MGLSGGWDTRKKTDSDEDMGLEVEIQTLDVTREHGESRAESDEEEGHDFEPIPQSPTERAKAKKMEEAEAPFVNLLILSAFTVAFAHGGNDVGNAVGPLCAILAVYLDGEVVETPDIPMWALCVGGAGFCFGIVLLGSNTISTVGTKITKLTPSKSYATQIGAAVAVLMSSALVRFSSETKQGRLSTTHSRSIARRT